MFGKPKIDPLDTIRNRLSSLETRERLLVAKVGKLQQRIVTLEESVGELAELVALTNIDIVEHTDRLKALESSVALLLNEQKPSGTIAITSKEDLAAFREAFQKVAEEAATQAELDKPALHCSIRLVKKGEGKTKPKSVARRVMEHMNRFAPGEEVLVADVKQTVLGDESVSSGGGHFSRTLQKLEALGLIERSGRRGDGDWVAITGFGKTQTQLVWCDLRDYNALIEDTDG